MTGKIKKKEEDNSRRTYFLKDENSAFITTQTVHMISKTTLNSCFILKLI